jgi:hypothetical protein
MWRKLFSQLAFGTAAEWPTLLAIASSWDTSGTPGHNPKGVSDAETD